MSIAETKKCAAVARDLNSAVNARLLAMALAAAEHEKMAKLDAELLDYLDVRDDKGERITDPKRTWHMAESFSKEYERERSKRLREMGYDLPEGHCPALCADEVVRIAEHAMVEVAEAHFPGTTLDRLLCAGLGKYREYLDLLTKLTVNAPNYRAPSIAA